jgi:hypothetical protein
MNRLADADGFLLLLPDADDTGVDEPFNQSSRRQELGSKSQQRRDLWPGMGVKYSSTG